MTPAVCCALLDISVLIDYPARRVAELADELAVSAVTVAELHHGVTATSDPLEQLRRRRRLRLVLELYDVLPFDAETAEYYGALAIAVRITGRKPRRTRWTCRSPRPPSGMACRCSPTMAMTSPASSTCSTSLRCDGRRWWYTTVGGTRPLVVHGGGPTSAWWYFKTHQDGG